MWGVGCIMAEMWTRNPILPGNTEQEQIKAISQLCGSFTLDVWPGLKDLELYKSVELMKGNKRKIKERLGPFIKDDNGCDLIEAFLTLDPKQRIDADAALNHDFFWSDPMPSDLSKMLSTLTGNMFQYFAEARRKMKQNNQNVRPQVNSSFGFDRVY